MKRNQKQKIEPVWCSEYRERIIKPKQAQRFTERAGRTQESRDGRYEKKEWKALRLVKLEMNPECERCEKHGRLIEATIVDHIKPVDLNPELFLVWENLQSLCETCHIIKTNADKKQRNMQRKLDNGKRLMKMFESEPNKPRGGGSKSDA